MVADAMTAATQEEMQTAMVVMRAEFDDKLKQFLVDVASKSTVAAMQASGDQMRELQVKLMGLASEIAELKRDRERLGKSRARDSYKPLKPDKLQSGTDGEWELFAEQMEGYMGDLYLGEGLRLL